MWGVSRWQQFQHSTIWFRIYDSHRTAFNLFTIRQSAVLASGASWLPNRDLERCDKWSYYHAVGASSITPQLYVCSRPLVSLEPHSKGSEQGVIKIISSNNWWMVRAAGMKTRPIAQGSGSKDNAEDKQISCQRGTDIGGIVCWCSPPHWHFEGA